MANTTITQLAPLTAVAADDELAIWDSSAAQTKKSTREDVVGATITGKGTITTNGKTVAAPADGTLALLEVAQEYTAKPTFAAGVTGGSQPNVNDDAAFYIPTPANAGLMVLMPTNYMAPGAGIIAFRCQNGSVGQAAVVAGGAGNVLDTRTDVALTGTTGTDGKITVSSNANNERIYVENRSGGVRSFAWFFITN